MHFFVSVGNKKSQMDRVYEQTMSVATQIPAPSAWSIEGCLPASLRMEHVRSDAAGVLSTNQTRVRRNNGQVSARSIEGWEWRAFCAKVCAFLRRSSGKGYGNR